MEEISNQVRFLLLTIIENDGDIDEFRRLGYSYFQIKDFIKGEIKNGNAEFADSILGLTEQGLEVRNKLSEELNYKHSGKVVSPKLSSKIQEIFNSDTIFIPSENELNF
ncbi:hypothetical protein DFQ03_2310 [Maribacter caenipelagi]|uniref:Uncharacterized protein n=1 Tax=Maribacter caenipelagi TaxID=1447781 RepID=A0A4R7CZZ9_9FLAO|nr:hypothetical protein [Maribacter caenipelagi]TDS14233.1 hypothetical protein DFQ03_2310 [Maribacter caenipelagi]